MTVQEMKAAVCAAIDKNAAKINAAVAVSIGCCAVGCAVCAAVIRAAILRCAGYCKKQHGSKDKH